MKRKYILILTAAMLGAISVFGQPSAVASTSKPTKQVQRAGNGDARGMQALKLTKEQVAKLDRLKQDAGKQMAAVSGDKRLSQDQKKVKMQRIMISAQKKFMAMLTPEQVKKLSQMKAQPNKSVQKGSAKHK